MPSAFTCAGSARRSALYNGPRAAGPVRRRYTTPKASRVRSPSVIIVGGWLCGESALATWAPFLASHGLVAVADRNAKPLRDQPAARARARCAARRTRCAASTRARPGPLCGRLDGERVAFLGYSLGGGARRSRQRSAAARRTCGASSRSRRTPATTRSRRTTACPRSSSSASATISRRPRASRARCTTRRATTPKLYFQVGGGADPFRSSGPRAPRAKASFPHARRHAPPRRRDCAAAGCPRCSAAGR